MAVWPASLPQCPLASSYSETPQRQTLRSQMDAGPAKVRRRFTAGTTDLAYAVNLTPAQVQTFEAFYDDDTDAGALPFDMPHPRTGTTVTVRFKGPYELTAIGGLYYRLSLTIEVLP